MVELVDTADLKSVALWRKGSSPFPATSNFAELIEGVGVVS